MALQYAAGNLNPDGTAVKRTGERKPDRLETRSEYSTVHGAKSWWRLSVRF